MQVTRIQYPVGQGCFHSGHIRWENDRREKSGDCRYIYDCGSMHQSALNDAIDACRNQMGEFDALFVSHLHEDHVNGIDHLLSSVMVNTVYLPYVNEAASVLDLIETDLNGALSASLIEATIDPRSWFGRRGVSRVVRVLASPAAGMAVEDVEPDQSNERMSRTADVASDSEIDQLRRSGARALMEEINSGRMLQVGGAGNLIDWTLVPHVDPAPANRLRAFGKDLRKASGLAPRQRLTAERLANALRNKTTRRRLRDCYEYIVDGGSRHNHNRVSMSLYSGPRNVGATNLGHPCPR